MQKELTPRIEHEIETALFHADLARFPPERHLKEREKQYCNAAIVTHDIFVIRETEEGWWRESIVRKDGDAFKKQIEKLRADKTVASGWFSSPRFTSRNGGWS